MSDGGFCHYCQRAKCRCSTPKEELFARITELESQVHRLTAERDRFHAWAMANGFCQLCPNCKSDGNCGHSGGW